MQEILIGILLAAQRNMGTAPSLIYTLYQSKNNDFLFGIKVNLLKNIEKIDDIQFFPAVSSH